MGFEFGRSEGFPTQYPPAPTPVTVDTLDVGLITTFFLLGISLVFALVNHRLYVNFKLAVKIIISLFIGAAILLGNFGQEWEVGEIVTRTPYKAGVAHEITASIGIKIGLRSVNVTLKNTTTLPHEFKREIINYNERFSWEWDQGRFGFGPYAGHLQQEFRAAQYRGAPIPILWVVEYFVIDGEGFRFGRFYRTAGWYTHIALWTAFPCWIIALIYSRTVIHYSGLFLGFTGGLQILANILWSVIRNPIPLAISFEDGIIRTKFGSSYWLTLISGILCLTLCAVITVMHYYFNQTLYDFFDVDSLSVDNERYLTSKEVQELQRVKSINVDDEIPLQEMKETEEGDEEYQPVFLKRGTTIKKVQPIKKRTVIQDNIYDNIQSLQRGRLEDPHDDSIYENFSDVRRKK